MKVCGSRVLGPGLFSPSWGPLPGLGDGSVRLFGRNKISISTPLLKGFGDCYERSLESLQRLFTHPSPTHMMRSEMCRWGLRLCGVRLYVSVCRRVSDCDGRETEGAKTGRREKGKGRKGVSYDSVCRKDV